MMTMGKVPVSVSVFGQKHVDGGHYGDTGGRTSYIDGASDEEVCLNLRMYMIPPCPFVAAAPGIYVAALRVVSSMCVP